MAVPEHLKITFRGKYNGTPEEFSFSLKMRSNVPLEQDPGVDDVDSASIRTALDTFWSTMWWSVNYWITGWRAYKIGPLGTMVGLPKIVDFDGGTEVKGIGGGTPLPPQVAACITTEALNRGPARFGRFFLPAPAMPLGADFRLSTSHQQQLLDDTVAFAKSVSDAIDLPDTIVGSSMVNISNIGAGTQQVVNNFRVGRVLDTQRRRRNQLAEEYLSSGQIDW